MLSVLDIFRIGIGPSSSHTVGPMRIARTFVRALAKAGKLERTARIAVELQGSLALTGVGHGTVDASILGLIGFAPDTTCPDEAAAALERVRTHGRLVLGGRQDIAFDPATDIDLAGHVIPDLHPNGMQLAAFDADGAPLSAAGRLRDVLEWAKVADEAGLDVFGVGEHHRADFAVSSPQVVLAAAAAVTSRIRLTSTVTVLSSADPVRTFEDFATLDLISGGRAELTAGRGAYTESFPLFGQVLARYDEYFEDRLDLLLRLRELCDVLVIHRDRSRPERPA